MADFLPWYSSVHRGAGYKSRRATAAYEAARARRPGLRRARPTAADIAILCRNTTEAINHLAYRLRLEPDDVVLTTVVEHHANLLPWGRVAERRYVECGPRRDLRPRRRGRRPRRRRPAAGLLAVTGASNVTGWLPPLAPIVDAAHERGVPVVLDAAQLAPHRPLPAAGRLSWPSAATSSTHRSVPASWSAPGRRSGGRPLPGRRRCGRPGRTSTRCVWTEPPEREEAGSPNVVGAVALQAAIDELGRHRLGRGRGPRARLWPPGCARGLQAIDGVRLLGPVGPATSTTDTLAVAAFVVEGMHHALVAARLSAEWGIGVRHGCFCAHPYLVRLLGLRDSRRRRLPRRGAGRRPPLHARGGPGQLPGSAPRGATSKRCWRRWPTSPAAAPPPVPYEQDAATGDFFPVTDEPGWRHAARELGTACSRG